MGDDTRPFFGGSPRSKRKVLHSHMDSQGVNQSTFVGILPIWIGTSEDQLSFKGVSCETSHWHLLSSNSETQFLFTQQSRCTLSNI